MYFRNWEVSSPIPRNPYLTVGEWHHFRLARKGSTVLVYDNNNLWHTATDVRYSGSISTGTERIAVGCAQGVTGWTVDGNIDGFRILNGHAIVGTNYTPTTASLCCRSRPTAPDARPAPTVATI